MSKSVGLFVALTVLSLSSVSLSNTLLAADVEAIVEEPAADDWTGFYLGVHGGYGWGESEADWIGTGTQSGLNGFGFSVDVDGPVFGGQVGADYDLGGLVVGVAADASWSGIDGTDCADTSNCPTPPPWPLAFGTYDVDWLATLRARLGYGTDSTLFMPQVGSLWLTQNSRSQT